MEKQIKQKGMTVHKSCQIQEQNVWIIRRRDNKRSCLLEVFTSLTWLDPNRRALSILVFLSLSNALGSRSNGKDRSWFTAPEKTTAIKQLGECEQKEHVHSFSHSPIDLLCHILRLAIAIAHSKEKLSVLWNYGSKSLLIHFGIKINTCNWYDIYFEHQSCVNMIHEMVLPSGYGRQKDPFFKQKTRDKHLHAALLNWFWLNTDSLS